MMVEAGWAAFILIAISELGDKTQLAVIALAAKMRAPLEVMLGVIAAFLVLNGVGVVVGEKLAKAVPMNWVKRGAGDSVHSHRRVNFFKRALTCTYANL